MISRHGFLKGDTVEFLNHHHAWTRGTVKAIEHAEHKIEGPNGTLVEKAPTRVHVLYFDSYDRCDRIRVVPASRVRAAK